MPAHDELHLLLHVVERVEDGQEALAGNRECEIGAVDDELIDEDLAAVPHYFCLTT